MRAASREPPPIQRPKTTMIDGVSRWHGTFMALLPMRLRPLVGLFAASACLALVACGDTGEGTPEGATGSVRQAAVGCPQVSASNLEFQNDACKRKKTPSNKDRFVGCPIVSTVSDGFVTGTAPHTVDGNALKGIVPADVNVTAIIIRRVGGVPYYRYLSNGTHDAAYQPWSSTKFMAVAGAGAALRKKSGGKVGLTANAAANGAPLGDLVTVIASYRQDRYTSNGLARYFLNIAGRPAVGALIHDWLGRPAAETYGGNYGAPTPGGLGYTFTEANGDSVTITSDETAGPANHLSAHTEAEFLKRLVAWDDAATRLPDLQKADVETLLYGAANSAWYPGQLGGLHSDITAYVQSALDMEKVEKESQGRWRTFGKVGFSGDGEFVLVSHTCLPVLDAKGQPVPNKGAEVVIATRAIQNGMSMVDRDQQLGAVYKDLFQKGILPVAQTEGPPIGGPGEDGGGGPNGPGGPGDPNAPPGASSSGGAPQETPDDAADGGCATSPRHTRAPFAGIALALVAGAALRRRRRR